ncbi:hypothetical protein Syun_023800 [Stephania yunnanensis]|uniref:Thioredoxin domain-containing protein n=1 Tax=Stephania yunnanensis TaxID=152371 RepID=A0AAP0I3W3_9MAGN
MGAAESVEHRSYSRSASLAHRSYSRTASTAYRSAVRAIHSSNEWRKQFQSLQGTNQLVVVDFSATWCGPCRTMEPVLEELASRYSDVIFVKIDIDELMDVAQEYGVQSVPMFMLIKEGKQVDKLVGADKGELERKIEKHRA